MSPCGADRRRRRKERADSGGRPAVLAVLLGEDCSDEPPDRSPVREDARHVGSASDLLVEALLQVVRPGLLPVGHGKGGEGKDTSGSRLFQQSRRACGKRSSSMATMRAVLCVHLLRRRLLIDRPDHGRHPGLGPAGDFGEQVGHEVGAAALPPGRRRRPWRWRPSAPDEHRGAPTGPH